MSNPSLPITALPKTPAQLRAVLDRLEKNSSTTSGGPLQSVFDSIFDEATADQDVDLTEIVFISGEGTIDLAKADAASTHAAIGVVTEAAILGDTAEFQTHGIVGGFSGLTPGAKYYLSAATAGLVIATAPSSVGEYVVFLGIAISATELLFIPSIIVLL